MYDRDTKSTSSVCELFFLPSKSSAALRPDQGALVSSAGLSVPGHSLERIADRVQSIAQTTGKIFSILVP